MTTEKDRFQEFLDTPSPYDLMSQDPKVRARAASIDWAEEGKKDEPARNCDIATTLTPEGEHEVVAFGKPSPDGRDSDEDWTLVVNERPPEDRILICGDCIEPEDTIVYHNGFCLVLDLKEGTVEVSTKRYLVWKLREG